MTTDNIAQIINIFKTQAEKENDKATLQKVLRENEQAERVLNETMAWHHLQVQPMNPWMDPPLPRQILRQHIHHVRSKSTPKWT